MDELWKDGLWSQFGAAIDMLEDAIRACPEDLWHDRFWTRAHHTLFFLDLYLYGRVEGFAPPPPFGLEELDPAGVLPPRMYTPDELLAYLRHCRREARAAVAALTEESARRVCRFSWGEMTYGELLLYGIRHVQHHTGQLVLLLRQTNAAVPGWIVRARAKRP